MFRSREIDRAMKIAAVAALVTGFALSSTSFAQSAATASSIDELLDQVRAVESREGESSPSLIALYTELGLRYQDKNEPAHAAAATRRALDILRVNEGLYTLDQAPPATVYFRAGVSGRAAQTFVAREVTFAIRSPRTGSNGLINQLGQAVWSVNSGLPLARVQTLEDVYNQSMARTSFTLVMLAIAGSMALALGMIGIYGVISYAVSRRRREIGVRLALGAARTGILRQFLGQTARVSAVACVCGLVLSLALTRVMTGLLYGVSATDATTMVVVVASSTESSEDSSKRLGASSLIA